MNLPKHVVRSSKKHKRKRSRSRQSKDVIHVTLRSSSVEYSHSYRSRSVLQPSSISITDNIQSSPKISNHCNSVKKDIVDTHHRQTKKKKKKLVYYTYFIVFGYILFDINI